MPSFFRAVPALVVVALAINASAAAAAPHVDDVLASIFVDKPGEVAEALRQGFDANAKDEHGYPVLFIAVEMERTRIVKLLLNHKADPNCREPEWKMPLLSHACAYGDNPMVDLLLKHGADPKLVDKHGGTALEEAAFAGDKKLVDRLRKLGLKSNWPLHVAAGLGDLAQVKRLTIDKAMLEQPTKGWLNTPLMFAIGAQQTATAKYLLQRGANPNLPNDMRMFPLHYAVMYGSQETCELLLKHGADVNARVEAGEVALDLCDDDRLKKLLIGHGALPQQRLPKGKKLVDWWPKQKGQLKKPASSASNN